MKNDRPWWWPVKMDDAYFDRLRTDYPEHADWSDEDLAGYYDEYRQPGDYSDTWDHLGDARADWAKLADWAERAAKVLATFQGEEDVDPLLKEAGEPKRN